MDKNKVRFGLSKVYAGTFTESNGAVTLGTPQAIPGAVSLTLDPETAESIFYADNSKYWAQTKDNGYTGELEMAKFPDEFKTAFMNYITLTGGGTAEIKTKSCVPIYLIFQIEGDVQARRTILYNVTLGAITEEHNTTEEEIEPATETLNINVIGDNITGMVKASYEPQDAPYDTIYTQPPVPALPGESS